MKKQRFSFFGNQSGEIIMTTLAVISIISIAYGLFSFGKKAQEAKQGLVDVTRYADSKNTADPNKAQKNNQAILVNTAIEGGETAVGAANPDDTQLTSALDACGAFNLPDQKRTPEQNKKAEAKKQNDKKIGDNLKKNKLPSDQLTKDVVKGIQKIVGTNSKLNTDDKTKENAVIEIIKLILQDLSKNKAKSTVLNTVKKELNNQKILADAKIAKTQKQLNSALSEKDYIERQIQVYDDLHDEGYIVTDNPKLNYWKDRLNYVEGRIARLDDELEALKQEESEKQYTVDLTENQGQDESTTGDATSSEGESTAIEDETTMEEETTAEEETTEEETTESSDGSQDSNLIHGVVPTKVTAHGFVWNGIDDTNQVVGEQYLYFEFWNVGKLGGEQYAKVTLKKVWKMNSNYSGDTIPDYTTEGYFTGGPNGEIFLQIDNGFSWKLSNGKEIIIPQEVKSTLTGSPSVTKVVDSVPIDNPEAFNGWAD